MRIPVCSPLAASVVLACAQVPAPAPLNPTPTIALGDAEHFGRGVIVADEGTVWFELATAANVRLLYVGDDASVAMLAQAQGGRRAAGQHRAVIAETGVQYSRETFASSGWHAAPPGGVVGQTSYDCATAQGFALLYARNRRAQAAFQMGSDSATAAPDSPAAFSPWDRAERVCDGPRIRTPNGGYIGPTIDAGGYWLLIAADRPLDLQDLDAVLTPELGALDVEALVRALPQSLVTADAPGARWAAYAVAR